MNICKSKKEAREKSKMIKSSHICIEDNVAYCYENGEIILSGFIPKFLSENLIKKSRL